MNKKYHTLSIIGANLSKIQSDTSRAGYKNIIGIVVKHNEEELFYSILDDCFFRILPSFNNNYKQYSDCIFVEVYNYIEPPFEFKTVGMYLYDELKKEYITKEEIINNYKCIMGYYSDFDYDKIKNDNKVNYLNKLTIEDNIIDTELEYEEKLKRPIIHTYGMRKISSNKKLMKTKHGELNEK